MNWYTGVNWSTTTIKWKHLQRLWCYGCEFPSLKYLIFVYASKLGQIVRSKVGRNVWEKAGRNVQRVETSGNRKAIVRGDNIVRFYLLEPKFAYMNADDI